LFCCDRTRLRVSNCLGGFGGSCFPKDINALISVAQDLDIKPTMMLGAWYKNLEVRPERDWELLKGRAVS
jgi:UDP-glucose 6-dehydrogenase